MFFVVLAGVVVYGNTLDVPFYLDDYSSIVDNPVIYDRGSLQELWRYAPLRIAGYSTFAVNFYLNHFDPAGYHVVNILIHILAGLSLFVLTRGLLQTPVIAERISSPVANYLPLFAALLFVVHPLQTQAVTYIVQRLASLAALWYLAALACYVYGRIGRTGVQQVLLFSPAFLFAILAFFTKQNTFTLPLIVVVVELVFFPATRRRTLWSLLTAGGCGLLLWGVLVFLAGYEPLSLSSLDAYTRETGAISRSTYFLTQMEVLWKYIQLFFWPVGLHLEHDISFVQAITGWPIIVALVGHFAVLSGSVLAVRRFPLFTFGIFFFYISHLIESSFIPIRDIMFEHRSYLPNAGLCISTGWVLFALPAVRQYLRIAGELVAMSILLICSVLTWQRNAVWLDPVALWRDSAVHAPYAARPWNEYAKHLINQGKNREAIAVFLETMKRIGGNNLSPGLVLEETAVVNLMMALAKEKKSELALQVADDFLSRGDIKPLNRSKMLTNKGNLLVMGKHIAEAEKNYREAIQVFEKNIIPMNNLGVILMHQDRLEEAEDMFLRILEIDPKFEVSRKRLDKVRQMKKLHQRSAE